MLFGSSGIRQQYAKQLLDLGPLVGAALADFVDGKTVLVATDRRTSNYALSQAIISGLLAGGSEINFGGVAPTL